MLFVEDQNTTNSPQRMPARREQQQNKRNRVRRQILTERECELAVRLFIEHGRSRQDGECSAAVERQTGIPEALVECCARWF